VVSFIFADLISLPLLLIYRRQYGGRMALRLLAVLWAVIALAGLVTGYLFELCGVVPTSRPDLVAAHSVGLDATTALDGFALVVFAALLWLHRNREQLGGGAGYAQDPVCGMQVDISAAPAAVDSEGGVVYFCSEHCLRRFERRVG
jgi:YHS domain-containing protein